jgi:hypothetical protein
MRLTRFIFPTPGSWSSTDDRLYAHEAAGLLVGGEDLGPDQQLTCLSALMQPLLSQIEQYLPAVKSGANGVSNGVSPGKGEKLPVNMVLQVPHPLCLISGTASSARFPVRSDSFRQIVHRWAV